MTTVAQLYNQSLALMTDLYQLTMAYSYWRSGIAHKESVFHLFFRKTPFQSGFAVACGLRYTIDFLRRFQIEQSDIDYLGTVTGHDGRALFTPDFLQHLANLAFTCDIDAVPEGTVMFPYEPMLRISGPIIECQILETALINIWNFQTLVATKAARIREAAGDKPVLEFGARRAQGMDGALTGSWAAHVGGADSTSNVLAGKLFGIPVVGTHAHSWVMCFDQEIEAFKTYAYSLPNNCIFLVDTYDTIDGVKNAIEVGRLLREMGHDLLGVRLDSGDLAYLSQQARVLLDEAGFPDAIIVASNDIDEHVITSLNIQDAKIDAWGIGTKLITAYDQPALGCVYKLSAIRDPGGDWEYRIKLSEQAAKISTPGIQQVRRFIQDGLFAGDGIFDESNGSGSINEGDVFTIVDPFDMTRRKRMPAETAHKDLLIPVFRRGELCYDMPDRETIKDYVAKQVGSLHPTIRRLLNPHEYPTGLELGLHQVKTDLILQSRGFE